MIGEPLFSKYTQPNSVLTPFNSAVIELEEDFNSFENKELFLGLLLQKIIFLVLPILNTMSHFNRLSGINRFS